MQSRFLLKQYTTHTSMGTTNYHIHVKLEIKIPVVCYHSGFFNCLKCDGLNSFRRSYRIIEKPPNAIIQLYFLLHLC